MKSSFILLIVSILILSASSKIFSQEWKRVSLYNLDTVYVEVLMLDEEELKEVGLFLLDVQTFLELEIRTLGIIVADVQDLSNVKYYPLLRLYLSTQTLPSKKLFFIHTLLTLFEPTKINRLDEDVYSVSWMTSRQGANYYDNQSGRNMIWEIIEGEMNTFKNQYLRDNTQ